MRGMRISTVHNRLIRWGMRWGMRGSTYDRHSLHQDPYVQLCVRCVLHTQNLEHTPATGPATRVVHPLEDALLWLTVSSSWSCEDDASMLIANTGTYLLLCLRNHGIGNGTMLSINKAKSKIQFWFISYEIYRPEVEILRTTNSWIIWPTSHCPHCSHCV